MTDTIYVVVGKGGKSLAKSGRWEDTRKLLVYTSEAKARSAMKARGVSLEDYDIIEYLPKGHIE